MISSASAYSQHHSMQEHDAKYFLSSAISAMDWTNEAENVVMDIGCGTGDTCRHILFPFFSKVKKVIAVDVNPDLLEHAKLNNAHPKIEYHKANIENRSSIERWTNKITKIVSIYCFNWLRDQKQALHNVYQLLQPGGEAALLFVLRTPLWNSFPELKQNPKWSMYLKDYEFQVPESHFKNYSASHYKEMLEEIGFCVSICNEEKRKFAFLDDEDGKANLVSARSCKNYIPDSLMEEFKEDYFQGFLKYCGRNSEGRPVLHYSVITLLIRKL